MAAVSNHSPIRPPPPLLHPELQLAITPPQSPKASVPPLPAELLALIFRFAILSLTPATSQLYIHRWLLVSKAWYLALRPYSRSLFTSSINAIIRLYQVLRVDKLRANTIESLSIELQTSAGSGGSGKGATVAKLLKKLPGLKSFRLLLGSTRMGAGQDILGVGLLNCLLGSLKELRSFSLGSYHMLSAKDLASLIAAWPKLEKIHVQRIQTHSPLPSLPTIRNTFVSLTFEDISDLDLILPMLSLSSCSLRHLELGKLCAPSQVSRVKLHTFLHTLLSRRKLLTFGVCDNYVSDIPWIDLLLPQLSSCHTIRLGLAGYSTKVFKQLQRLENLERLSIGWSRNGWISSLPEYLSTSGGNNLKELTTLYGSPDQETLNLLNSLARFWGVTYSHQLSGYSFSGV